MLPSHSGVLAEAINKKILTRNLPDSPYPHLNFPHSHPYSPHSRPDSPHSRHSPHSHPDSPHSHLDSSRSHPDSPRSHPDSPCSHHSPHSVSRFPIPAFTDSPKFMKRSKKVELNVHQ